MKRIVLHWTAGPHKPTAADHEHYHFYIDGTGAVHAGKFPPEANDVSPLVSGRYAAHVAKANTGAIGVAVCAMAGAVERPFRAGDWPIRQEQVDALVTLTRSLCERYGIPVSRTTVLTHAEVQPTLGIQQAGKWDITWLPGMSGPGDPVAVGDRLRALISVPPAVSPWQGFLDWLRKLFCNL